MMTIVPATMGEYSAGSLKGNLPQVSLSGVFQCCHPASPIPGMECSDAVVLASRDIDDNLSATRQSRTSEAELR